MLADVGLLAAPVTFFAGNKASTRKGSARSSPFFGPTPTAKLQHRKAQRSHFHGSPSLPHLSLSLLCIAPIALRSSLVVCAIARVGIAVTARGAKRKAGDPSRTGTPDRTMNSRTAPRTLTVVLRCRTTSREISSMER
eukprot:3458003-Rhodomonas_salina.1